MKNANTAPPPYHRKSLCLLCPLTLASRFCLMPWTGLNMDFCHRVCAHQPPPLGGQQHHTPLISEAEENYPPKQGVSDGIFSRYGRPVVVYIADGLPVLIGVRLDIGNYCTLRLKSNLQRKIPKDKKTTRQRSFYGKQRRLSLVVNKLNNQWIQLGRTFLG